MGIFRMLTGYSCKFLCEVSLHIALPMFLFDCLLLIELDILFIYSGDIYIYIYIYIYKYI